MAVRQRDLSNEEIEVFEETLPKCPFCGYLAGLTIYEVRKSFEAEIMCSGECGVTIRTITLDTERFAVEDVVSKWSKRV